MLKKIISQLLKNVAQSETLFQKIGKFFQRINSIIHTNRLIFLLQSQYKKEKNINSTDKNLMFVTDGIFEGLLLLSDNMYAGVILPTLTGCYEAELNPIFNKIIQKKYHNIINIGCAEGYYAVGLALKMPNTKVFAYDTEQVAQYECSQNATINKVTDRVIVKGFFAPEDFKNLSKTETNLVFTDCEGYEKMLFTAETVKHLRTTDVLVEIHDFVDATISQQMKTVFAETHDCEVVKYITDKERFATYHYPLIDKLHLQPTDVYLMYAENRWPQETEWFFFTVKK
jgi:precorrin-6B methylase 2